LDEAAQRLEEIINKSDFVSKVGKSKHQVYFADLISALLHTFYCLRSLQLNNDYWRKILSYFYPIANWCYSVCLGV
jgi:hypothetical protein